MARSLSEEYLAASWSVPEAIGRPGHPAPASTQRLLSRSAPAGFDLRLRDFPRRAPAAKARWSAAPGRGIYPAAIRPAWCSPARRRHRGYPHPGFHRLLAGRSTGGRRARYRRPVSVPLLSSEIRRGQEAGTAALDERCPGRLRIRLLGSGSASLGGDEFRDRPSGAVPWMNGRPPGGKHHQAVPPPVRLAHPEFHGPHHLALARVHAGVTAFSASPTTSTDHGCGGPRRAPREIGGEHLRFAPPRRRARRTISTAPLARSRQPHDHVASRTLLQERAADNWAWRST